MKTISRFLNRLWRVWFAFTILVSTLVLSPFLFTSQLSPRFFYYFSRVAKAWSAIILYGSFFYIKRTGVKIDRKKQYIVVSNHSSPIDIMMTYLVFPGKIMFIGKAELAKVPLFGYFYKNSNLLLDRSSLESKRRIASQVKDVIRQERSLAIYPEGTSKKKKPLIPFKDGAFNFAIETQTPILPITFVDNRTKFPAHDFSKGMPGRLRAVVHEPVPVEGLTLEDRDRLKKQVFSILEEDLKKNDRYR